MPRESTITAAIKRTAEGLGWWVMKIHGGPMQLSGVPDLLCLRNGRAVWLEVKQPGKKATALQKHRMAEIFAVGGAPCFVVTNPTDAGAILMGAAFEGARQVATCCRPRCRQGVESR